MNLHDWSPERLADVVDLDRPGALSSLVDEYGRIEPHVLSRVLANAFTVGARTAVIEYRYLDPDYRDEHSRFYSTTFRRYPSVAHRVHFFTDRFDASVVVGDEPPCFAERGYAGYTVLRPLPGAPIGRTMLAAPSDFAPHVTCATTDTVNLFGEKLTVRAAPFVSQDAQLSVCAHATLWMIGYYHHLKFGSRRWLPSEITDAVPEDVGRGTPSLGLTVYQLSAASSRLGLPALVYGTYPDPPPGESLLRIACRYLNSGMPVIVGGGEHAFVLVGYERHRPGQSDERIRFIRHDDQDGPYTLVSNYLFDEYSPWEFLVVPLPRKVYMSGEDAEIVGAEHLRQALDEVDNDETRRIRSLASTGESRKVSFRSTVVSSNSFKSGLINRGVPEPVAASYRRMQMSRWIWVVELLDRDLRQAGKPCVLAEAVIDATDSLRNQQVLSWRVPGLFRKWDPDTRRQSSRPLPDIVPLRSIALVDT